MWDLVGYPEDRFSHKEAQLLLNRRYCWISFSFRFLSFKISALIAFDTEYCDPKVFISDKPKVDIRRNMNGTSVMSAQRGTPRPPLRNTQSCLATPQYESIGMDENTHGREV